MFRNAGMKTMKDWSVRWTYMYSGFPDRVRSLSGAHTSRRRSWSGNKEHIYSYVYHKKRHDSHLDMIHTKLSGFSDSTKNPFCAFSDRFKSSNYHKVVREL